MRLGWRAPAPPTQIVESCVVFGSVAQLSQVSGDVTIGTDRPPYRVVAAAGEPFTLSMDRARAQPSRLLLARHQIVPFTGRDQMLAKLDAWVSSPDGMAVQLVHAAGGQGKTRLAAEVGARCAATGWAVWQVLHAPDPAPPSRMGLPGPAVFAIVDYADRWPASALLALLTDLRHLQLRTGRTVRVLLLARSAGYWWPAVAQSMEGDGFAIAADATALPSLSTVDDRAGLFRDAAARFATALGVDRNEWPAPPLDDEQHGQILAVHMAALASVEAHRHGDAPPIEPLAVSAYLLRRESVYWESRPKPRVTSATLHRATCIATLTGALPRPAAREVLRRTDLAADAPAADLVIDEHRELYPPVDPRTVLEALHPDRLGEDLVALSVPDESHPDFAPTDDVLPAALPSLLAPSGDAWPVWAPAAITVLVETALRWPHVARDALFPLVRQYPALAMAAGGATLTRLTAIDGLDPAVLEALEPLLPHDQHIDLDVAAAAVTVALARHHLPGVSSPARRAGLLTTLSRRLANAGRRAEALASTEEAVALYRRLADGDRARHLPGLALALTNRAHLLSRLGRRKQALDSADDATARYRELARAEPDRHLGDLASSLDTLGTCLAEIGRREEALDRTAEALAIRRAMNTGLADLAQSLHNHGVSLYETGRLAEAMAAVEEAAALYQRLVGADKAAHLPGLALAYSTLDLVLSKLGRWNDAIRAGEVAIGHYRTLVEVNPAGYAAELAIALINLASSLSLSGRPADALQAAAEATGITRRLADADPIAHLGALSVMLGELACRLLETDRPAEALDAVQEATGIARRLAHGDPGAHRRSLAFLLTTLSAALRRAGRPEESLAAAYEAVAIRRCLVSENRTAHLPDLAKALDAVSCSLADLDRREEALGTAGEALAIHRKMARTEPAAHEPELAHALTNLVSFLHGLDRHEEAFGAATEALTIRRRLADADPAAHRHDLAWSLRAYAAVAGTLDDPAAALEAMTEAIEILESLTPRPDDELAVANESLAQIMDRLGPGPEGRGHRGG